MLDRLTTKKTQKSARKSATKDKNYLNMLFGETAIETVLQVIEHTERREVEDTKRPDVWDVRVLDRDDEED